MMVAAVIIRMKIKHMMLMKMKSLNEKTANNKTQKRAEET